MGFELRMGGRRRLAGRGGGAAEAAAVEAMTRCRWWVLGCRRRWCRRRCWARRWRRGGLSCVGMVKRRIPMVDQTPGKLDGLNSTPPSKHWKVQHPPNPHPHRNARRSPAAPSTPKTTSPPPRPPPATNRFPRRPRAQPAGEAEAEPNQQHEVALLPQQVAEAKHVRTSTLHETCPWTTWRRCRRVEVRAWIRRR